LLKCLQYRRYPNWLPKPAHKPSAVPKPSTAARAVSSLVCPYRSPVIAMDAWPSRSAAALICTPDSNHATAAEWRSECAPTSAIFAFAAAVSTVRRRLSDLRYAAIARRISMWHLFETGLIRTVTEPAVAAGSSSSSSTA